MTARKVSEKNHKTRKQVNQHPQGGRIISTAVFKSTSEIFITTLCNRQCVLNLRKKSKTVKTCHIQKTLAAIAYLALVNTTALAAGPEDVRAQNGKWSAPSDPAPYSITDKGITGVDKKNCGQGYQQTVGMVDGAKWLAAIDQAQKSGMLPANYAQSARKDVQKDQQYPRVTFFCQGSKSDGVLIAPDARLVLSCADGDCDVARHTRVR